MDCQKLNVFLSLTGTPVIWWFIVQWTPCFHFSVFNSHSSAVLLKNKCRLQCNLDIVTLDLVALLCYFLGCLHLFGQLLQTTIRFCCLFCQKLVWQSSELRRSFVDWKYFRSCSNDTKYRYTIYVWPTLHISAMWSFAVQWTHVVCDYTSNFQTNIWLCHLVF